MEIRYSINDLQVLCNVLRSRHRGFDFLSFYEGGLDKIRNELRERELSERFIEDCLRDWLADNNFKRVGDILNFLYNIELRRVPLYINDHNFKMFAEWRLKIAK